MSRPRSSHPVATLAQGPGYPQMLNLLARWARVPVTHHCSNAQTADPTASNRNMRVCRTGVSSTAAVLGLTPAPQVADSGR